NATVNTPLPQATCVNYAGGIFAANCVHTTAMFESVTWTAGASYQLSTGQFLYAKGSRGYRPGGVNGIAQIGGDPLYQPEYDTSVELGFKGDYNLANMRVRTNLALFHDDYTGIQKHVTVVSATGNSFSVITNVAAATIQGIELETILEPVE